MDSRQPKMRRCQSRDSKRGRNKLREVVVMPAPMDCPILAHWAGVKTIGVIYRSRDINGKIEVLTETSIRSFKPQVWDLSKRIREHWSFENQQQYILDVSFSEDAIRIRKGNSPKISSIISRLMLGILQQDTTIKDNICGMRRRCDCDNSQINRLIAYFSSV